MGVAQELLDAKGIIRKTKDVADANALGVVDRAIMTLKKRLAESLSEEAGEWASRIKEVVSAYNAPRTRLCTGSQKRFGIIPYNHC